MNISVSSKYISSYHVNDNEEPSDWIPSQEKAKSYTERKETTGVRITWNITHLTISSFVLSTNVSKTASIKEIEANEHQRPIKTASIKEIEANEH